jgi:hypothetical protein
VEQILAVLAVLAWPLHLFVYQPQQQQVLGKLVVAKFTLQVVAVAWPTALAELVL